MSDTPAIGHNSGVMIADRVAELTSTANRWIIERPELVDQDTADRCSAFLDQLTAAAKEVEAARKAEKQPHMDAAKAVDERYRPLADRLDAAKTAMKRLLTVWLQKLDRQRQEEARRQREEADRLAAEARAREAEAARTASQGGDVVGAMVEAGQAAIAAEEAQKQAARAAKAPTNLQSRMGARTKALRTIRRARVASLSLALAHYRTHPEIAATIERLANADLRAGAASIPGIEIVTEQVAA